MDMRKLVFDLVGCDWNGPVEEVAYDGMLVRYDDERATIGFDTIPAKARGYMLLAKGIMEGKTSFELQQKAHFDACGVMMDVSFGGVVKVSAVKRYLEYMALHGMSLFMLYTEDVYEVDGYPYFGYQRGRYTIAELREIDDYAAALGIEVVPCIQTFGHLGKFLRYGVHGNIAENENVLLPGEEKTYAFIEACIAAMRKAFRSNRIHIGCDETRGLGFGKTFIRDGFRDRFSIFNEHLSRVVEICKKYDYHPMMWSDMYFAFAASNRSEDFGMEIEVPQYAVDSMPDADMVFWDYYHDYNDFYRVNIEKHKKFNRKTLFAGGIWLWNGSVPNFRYTYDTVKPALEECLKGGVKEVFGTAWAYGDITHMLGLPCFAMYSEYCWRGLDCTKDDIYDVAAFVTKTPFELTEAISDFFCGLDGDYNVGKLILWSDPLINLLCYDIDLAQAEMLYEKALETFEKYPDAPYIDYYKAVFTAVLHKCRLHRTLRDQYKAGDRVWLRRYSDEVLPQMEADFTHLYELHDDLWHRDNKTQGFEALCNRYAAAIERIRYTKKTIDRYLCGALDEIEALEPELIHGQKQKFLNHTRVMQTL